jgi:hypothetical protein
MKSDGARAAAWEGRLRSWLPAIVLLGTYLTVRGYHSFDGDQAYRLPLLLHRQDPGLYANDSFVRALDEFNPHRGSLALLDAVSRPFGLPAGLLLVFFLTFLATCWGVRRLARGAWPDLEPAVGWVAIGVVLSAKAGNIGTNHLFEAMVLDRLVAIALGWVAIAQTVTGPTTSRWRAWAAVALATIVHPSVGLQLAMVLGAGWMCWSLFGRSTFISFPAALGGLASLVAAVLPGLAINLPQRSTLMGDLPPDLFWLLSVELQNPQHMLPHLWRMPQWLAWSSYFALALFQVGFLTTENRRDPPSGTARAGLPTDSIVVRRRLSMMLGIILIGLGVAWYAIEIRHMVGVTIFQPFRAGTVARGLALILISGRVVSLWQGESRLGRVRASVLAVGFLGDWLLVVASAAELAVSAIEIMQRTGVRRVIPRGARLFTYFGAIAYGLNFLAHHDTESGHVPLLVALGVGWLAGGVAWKRMVVANIHIPTKPRWAIAAVLGAVWLMPMGALLASLIPAEHPAASHALVRGLVDRCRFYPVPLDDMERLAVWCRDHTPASARFIGPPGPKTFRLWSRRSLAFNRSGSPYHGAGLSDWFARFADHVDFRGTTQEFVRAYVTHRHEFEARYQAMTDSGRAALAIRQGADHVIAEESRPSLSHIDKGTAEPLELLHVEGRYAVYRVNPSAMVQHHR